MQRKSQRVALLGAVVLAALGAAGCKRPLPLPPPPPRPHEGAVVHVACPGDPAAAVVARCSKGWESREGAQVKVVLYQPGDDPPEADVWIVVPAEMPRWAAAGRLRELPDAFRAPNHPYDWSNLLPLYREKLLHWDGKAYALPLLCEAPLCFYRTDLFASAKYQDAFAKEYGRKLAPPATWEEYEELARFFARAEGGEPVPSLLALPADDEDLDRLFYQVAVPFARQAITGQEAKKPSRAERFSFHFDLDTGAPRIDTPGFVEALKLLQRLQQFRSPDACPQPPEDFAKGQAKLCLADASWIARFRKSDAVKGRFGITRVPGAGRVFAYYSGEPRRAIGGNRVPYLGSGGWLAVVPAKSTQSEAAFSLLAELSGREASRQVVLDPEWGGGAFRQSHFDNATGWSSFGLDQARTTELTESLRQTMTHPEVKNPVVRLRSPDQRAYARVLAGEVRRALTTEGADAGEALKTVARQWQELIDREGASKHRDAYLTSLGLER